MIVKMSQQKLYENASETLHCPMNSALQSIKVLYKH